MRRPTAPARTYTAEEFEAAFEAVRSRGVWTADRLARVLWQGLWWAVAMLAVGLAVVWIWPVAGGLLILAALAALGGGALPELRLYLRLRHMERANARAAWVGRYKAYVPPRDGRGRIDWDQLPSYYAVSEAVGFEEPRGWPAYRDGPLRRYLDLAEDPERGWSERARTLEFAREGVRERVKRSLLLPAARRRRLAAVRAEVVRRVADKPTLLEVYDGLRGHHG